MAARPRNQPSQKPRPQSRGFSRSDPAGGASAASTLPASSPTISISIPRPAAGLTATRLEGADVLDRLILAQQSMASLGLTFTGQDVESGDEPSFQKWTPILGPRVKLEACRSV